MMNRFSIAILLAVAGAGLVWAGETSRDWPQWRGPLFNGSAPYAHDLPTEWSATKNVAWKVALPSWSAATPVIWEGMVFITSAEEGFSSLEGGGGSSSADKILLLAVDRKNGAIRWSRVLGDGNRLYRKQNLSSPSPLTDGRHVWAMTGSGWLRGYDFAGNEVWARNIEQDYGKFGLNHGYASTPLLDGDRLYIQVLHGMKTDEPSYVLALDKKTGKTIWKVDRPTDAQAESPDDYSTPLIITADNRRQLVVSGGDYVTGHHLGTGQELWRMGGFNPGGERFYRTIASSFAIGDMVYTTSTRGKPFIAFRAGGKGDITAKAAIWSNNRGADVPTPTTDGERIYVVNDRGIAAALNAHTGAPVWEGQRLEPGTYSASPLLADGKIYATNEEGTTTVFRAGDQFEILAVNRLDSHTLASPVAAGDQIFLRTADHLYCFAKK